METWRTERFKEDPTTFEAPRVGWFMYYIVGRILTWWDDIKMKRQNRALQRKRLAEARTSKGTAGSSVPPVR